MYIRIKNISGKRYYQVVETFRDGYRVRQRSIASLGTNPTPKDAIQAYTRDIKRFKREIEEAAPDRHSSTMADRWCEQRENRIKRLEAKIVLLKSLPQNLQKTRHRRRPRNSVQPVSTDGIDNGG